MSIFNYLEFAQISGVFLQFWITDLCRSLKSFAKRQFGPLFARILSALCIPRQACMLAIPVQPSPAATNINIAHGQDSVLLPPKLQRRGLVFKRKLVTMERV